MLERELLMLFYFRNMINDVQYITIKEILSRVTRHPLLQNVNLEAVGQYVVDFIGIFGLPEMFEDKEVIVPIENFRGVLPCDLIAVNQVMDTCTGICLRSMTDTFMPTRHQRGKRTIAYVNYGDEMTFKVKNRIIFTSFEHGEVKVSYKSIPVDEDGFPLIIDNSPYLLALQAYIKVQEFTILYDNGKFGYNKNSNQVLQNAQQEYAWRAGQLQSEFSLPSQSEMESICRMWTAMIQRTTDFDSGFKYLGDREYIRQH